MSTMPDGWRQWPAGQKKALLQKLQERRYRLLRDLWQPYPWQVCPEPVAPHGMWLMMGGRGIGKTDGMARYVDEHVTGPACDPRIPGGHRIAIVAPTLGDAAESCVNGPSGLRAHNPQVRLVGGQGGSHVRWPNGAEGKLFGAYTPEDVERLRSGGNRCLVWLEEAAAMRKLGAVLEHTGLGLRIGPTPHYVSSTTPKPRKELIEMRDDPGTIVTHGRTADAFHLAQAVRDKLERKHAGSRLGQQELEGLLLEEVEGALWSWQMIERTRLAVHPPNLRTVVSVDPAVSNTEESDETGIVVVGYDPDTAHGYVLDDLSGRYSPDEWARVALHAMEVWDADYILGERNQGGDMVQTTIRAVDRRARYRDVVATKGKRLRAEPVSVLHEQGRLHVVGNLPELENQMCTWVPSDKPGDSSPDRLDAMVHGVTDLMIKTRRGGGASAA